MKPRLSDHIYLNKKERIGIILLITILILIIFIPFIWVKFQPSASSEFSNPTVRDVNDVSLNSNSNRTSASKYKRKNKPINYFTEKYFYFNPEKINEVQSKQLGIPTTTYKNLRKYLSAGGRIKKASDLSKIYGMTPELYEKLKPYIEIVEDTFSTAYRRPSSPMNVIKQPVNVNINQADADDFDKIPGIGEVLSQRILKYRNALGGFYHVNQIAEVFGISDSLYQTMAPYISCSEPVLQKISLRSTNLETLDRHPYISIKQAKIIIAFLAMHPSLNDPKELYQIKALDSLFLQKTIPYVTFD
ncbi:MAG: helix-hairpin-helix domain-containing protein [Bacteroidota bacterium]|nr:helix-hairpin-helix domain-containing protein [Bacteroidota bacterium]